MAVEINADEVDPNTFDPREFNQQVIAEFRANEGKVGGFFEGSDLVLLTTTGARSGEPRTSPVMYFEDGGKLYVIASMGGADQNPAWYHNLRANPDVTAEIGTESFKAKAEVVEGTERDDLYAKVSAAKPQFAEYQSKTTRVIPVVELRRAS
ncbi:nitroreductase family deazaflavin-dependent oxidoreductase [Nonomuraea rhizosphaerae]|uniref:nitroreductase family deazaflavin-dependent oxidoreductase n=1 Tax=Nonomuraea rhizosphaerae TaxID=2665663 RepID=UPI001C5FA785|nr:nitroreductase family deazaflavin-dependent oxidoreductase [Nonomuraea rhizosphaerae]